MPPSPLTLVHGLIALDLPPELCRRLAHWRLWLRDFGLLLLVVLERFFLDSLCPRQSSWKIFLHTL